MLQNDGVIWEVIGHNHCSFRVKTEQQGFCRNEYNVTGLCNRRSCPLANSTYATIIEKDGKCYLYKKVPARAQTPSKLWEKIKLVENYQQAIEQIDRHLEFWPEFLIHKNKQRFTKIVFYLMKRRKLRMTAGEKLVPIKQKVERRERTREAKAEKVAHIEHAIEKELLERLQTGTYEDIYNYPMKKHQKALDKLEEEIEYVEEDIEESEEEIEDLGDVMRKKRKIEVEYENELEELDNLMS